MKTDELVILGSGGGRPRSTKNHVPSQVKKFRNETNINQIIAAEDGLKIRVADLLN